MVDILKAFLGAVNWGSSARGVFVHMKEVKEDARG
jgi:hypothetical protein